MSIVGWLCVITAVLILQLVIGVGVGRAVSIADQRTPSVRAGGEDPAHRGAPLGEAAPERRAHLRAAR